jgi:hypothetical protein
VIGSTLSVPTTAPSHPDPSGSTSRYTRDGSEQLEHRLARTCEHVRSAIQLLVPPARLEGLLLGGGYGRGEGGVLRAPGREDEPYNDLEFYVLTRGSILLAESTLRPKLHAAQERLGAAAGIEIEFKLSSLQRLRRSSISMFSYDLVSGHRWLLGSDALLAACEHHRDGSRIPMSEAARLLMNRCSGLLFSAERLARRGFDLADADFVGRNLAKAQLGLGDVFLTAHGQYDWSCLERHQRLRHLIAEQDLTWAKSLLHHHGAGIEFKLHPARSMESREALQARHIELTALARQVWLWLEARRLGKAFGSIWDYASSRVNKCPETQTLKNRLVSVRTFGPSAFLRPSASRYPRERLFHSLSLMLFESGCLTRRETLRAVQSALQTTASTLPDLVRTYERLWSRFN